MVKRFISVVVFVTSLTSFSCFAESVDKADHNRYFKCQHTQQKVDRTKACPCGCNKKKKAKMRITSASDNCESDDVVAHTPQFERLLASAFESESARVPVTVSLFLPHYAIQLTSHSRSPEVPPG